MAKKGRSHTPVSFRPLLEQLSKTALSDAVKDLIKQCAESDSSKAILGIAAASTAPILIPAIMLVGLDILKRRSERQKQQEFDHHCQTITHLLQNLDSHLDAAADQLDEIYGRSHWIWARLSGADQAMLANRVAEQVRTFLLASQIETADGIDGLRIYEETVLWKLDLLHDQVRALAEKIIAKYERTERDLRLTIEDRERRIAELESALRQAQAAAEGGDAQAEAAIQAARATGELGLLQSVIARIADERYRDEVGKYVERCREVAAIARLRGDMSEAGHRFNEILRHYPDDFRATIGLGTVSLFFGRLAESQEKYEQALVLAGKDEARQSDVYTNLANVLLTRHNFAGAEEIYRRSIAIDERTGALEGLSINYSNLGIVQRLQGNLSEAETSFQKALALDKQLNRWEGVSSNYTGLGILMAMRGDLTAAKDAFNQALAIDEKLGRPEGVAAIYGNLGKLLEQSGDLEGAEAMHRKSLAIEERLGHLEGMISDYANLTELLAARGDFAGAERMYRLAIGLEEKLGRHSQIAGMYKSLGDLATKRGDEAAAQAAYDQAQKLQEQG